MNRFNNAPKADEFALIPDGTYDSILESAVLDDVSVWENGVSTGRTTEGIKMTFRIIEAGYEKRKMFKTLKFETDTDFEAASNQLNHLGVWETASKGKDEAECITIAANSVYKLVEGPVIVLYVGSYKDRNYCKIQKLRESAGLAQPHQPTNHAPQATQMPAPPQMNNNEKLPF